MEVTRKTENLTNFSIYLKDNEALKHTIVPIIGVPLRKPQNKGGSIHTKTDFELYCPQCKLSDYRKNGKIERSNRQRYKCNGCHKSFSLSEKVVNLESLFETLYDKQHLGQSYMLNTKYKKVHASKTDARYTRFFDARLQELDFENRYKQTEKIKMAFKDTNLYIDNLENVLLSKQKDTFFFFLNYRQADIAYQTEFKHYQLVRIHNINLYTHHTCYPLFHCNCRSNKIGRYATNNNGRSRLICKTCNRIFVIRLNNIVSKSYFLKTFIEMFNRAVPNYMLVDELAEQMYSDFFNTKFYQYFEKLVYNFKLITHMTKHHIMRLFLNMQYHRYLIHMTRHANRYLVSRDREVTNIKYFAINKDLDFLKDDENDIDTVIRSHKTQEALVPELFDENMLLDEALEGIFYLNTKKALN